LTKNRGEPEENKTKAPQKKKHKEKKNSQN